MSAEAEDSQAPSPLALQTQGSSDLERDPSSHTRAAPEEEVALLKEPTSFGEVWLHPYHRALLKSYAAKKHAEENFLFVEEVLAMRQEKDVRRIRRIYDEYVAKSSPFEVNLNDPTRQEIEERIGTEEGGRDLSIFDAAAEELVRLIKEGVYPEFVRDLQARRDKSRAEKRKGTRTVVVIGGGFVGAMVARLLDEMGRFHVVLMDPKEYLEYTPQVVHGMVNPPYLAQWHVPYTDIVRNGRFIMAAPQLVTKEHVVAAQEQIPYDYLVLSPGSSYRSQFKGGSISTSYRLKKIEFEFQGLKKAAGVLVIGGGLVGVEISSEIKCAFPEKRVIVVEANQTLLKRSPKKAQTLALKALEDLGVEVILGERVVKFDPVSGHFETDRGRELRLERFYIATGPTPNTEFLRQGFSHVLDERGQVRVTNTLQVEGFENVFSGGDCCDFPVEKNAFNATIHGVAIANNITRLERGKPAAAFGTKGIPKPRRITFAQMISLGPKNCLFIFREGYSTMTTLLNNLRFTLSKMSQEQTVGKRGVSPGFGVPPKALPALPDDGARDERGEKGKGKGRK